MSVWLAIVLAVGTAAGAGILAYATGLGFDLSRPWTLTGAFLAFLTTFMAMLDLLGQAMPR